MKWLAAPALALTTIVFLVHTLWVKDLARRTLESRVGGDLQIAQLDYRLWLGEARATGVTWTSADDAISVRVAELFVDLSWTGRVCAPKRRRLDPESGPPNPALSGVMGYVEGK